MALLSGVSTLSYTDLYSSFTEVPGPLEVGQLQPGPQGKWFRLALAGGSALVVGNVLQSSVIDTQFDDMAVPAAVASGATGNIAITNGTTTVVAHAYEGGTAEVSVTPGLGEEYTIIAHNTPTSGGTLNLVLDRPIRTAWTTSTKVTLRRSPWSGVIQAPATTLTGSVAGVANYAIPSGSYGFVQTAGVGAALSDATSIIAGSAVASPSGTAGCVTLGVAGLPNVGFAMRAAASGKTIPVFITIE